MFSLQGSADGVWFGKNKTNIRMKFTLERIDICSMYKISNKNNECSLSSSSSNRLFNVYVTEEQKKFFSVSKLQVIV